MAGDYTKDELEERIKLRKDLAKESRSITGELVKQVHSEDQIDQILGSIFQNTSKIAQLNKELKESKGEMTTEELRQRKLNVEAVEAAHELSDGIKARLAGSKAMIVKAKAFNLVAKANPWIALVAIIIAIGVAFFKFQKAIAQTRKDLGVSAVEAAKLEVRFVALGFAAKAWGLETEDIKSSFNAIRETFGGIDQATNSFVLNLAKAQLTTGATAEQLAQIVSIQESISDLSREALLQQTKTTAELIRQAGVAPSAIFRDIAENAEFFAKFAKEGGDNLVRAGIQARKLGLNMSHVSGVANSLLDFESSIEKQLTASVLLGRQINLDKARQLAMTNDMTGMMDEILRQVGGEAEFTAMNFKQREALADSVGVNVAQLTRLVKNQISPEQFAIEAGMTEEQRLLSNIYGELQGQGLTLGGINTNTRPPVEDPL